MILAALRKKVGIGTGDDLILQERDGAIQLHTREAAIREVQRYYKQFDDGRSWMDELIESRLEEARRECEE
ncbi:MAG TPA: hypothetical protein VNH18_28525 [Bryobacteraceae bacterium]|nr:hypothetical protein [Bryobacteraceae bacterium]